jgi:hypothetical protein
MKINEEAVIHLAKRLAEIHSHSLAPFYQEENHAPGFWKAWWTKQT